MPSLFSKILLSMLLVALVPLLATSLLLSLTWEKVRETLSARIAESSDQQASESLKLHAEQVADSIATLLKSCEDDVRLLATLRTSPGLLKQIYDSRTSEIWYRRGSPAAPREIRERVPLYHSLAVIDASGEKKPSPLRTAGFSVTTKCVACPIRNERNSKARSTLPGPCAFLWERCMSPMSPDFM